MEREKMSAKDVAKWFLAYNREMMNEGDAEYISNLKLQKLLYYAQGCFLALKGQALFGEPIVAWKHGPVVEDVYHQYKEYGASGIVFDEKFDFSSISSDIEAVLEEVYDVFGQYSAWKLRNMTHNETPWKSTKQNSVIPAEVIRNYFLEEYVV